MNNFLIRFMRSLMLPGLILALVSTQSFAQNSMMTESESVSILHLNVSNLDRSLEFYRDVLGMEYVNPPGEPRAGTGLIDDDDAMLRTTVLQTPNGAFSFELVEWLNTPVRAMHPSIQDPGEIMMAMTVRDVDSLLAQAKEIGLQILTENGQPYESQTNRAVMVRDPDGFIVELEQFSEREFDAPGDVSNVNVWLTVADLNETVEFYNHVFGMDLAEPNPAGPANDRIQALFGDRSIATMRAVRGTFPGSEFLMNFQEFTGPTRRPVAHRVQDPGGPILLIGVNNFADAVENLKNYGGTVGTDQASAMLGSGATASWTRDPNGLLIMLSQGQ